MTGPVSEVPDLCCRKFPSAQATEDPRHSGVLIRAPIHTMNERSSVASANFVDASLCSDSSPGCFFSGGGAVCKLLRQGPFVMLKRPKLN